MWAGVDNHACYSLLTIYNSVLCDFVNLLVLLLLTTFACGHANASEEHSALTHTHSTLILTHSLSLIHSTHSLTPHTHTPLPITKNRQQTRRLSNRLAKSREIRRAGGSFAYGEGCREGVVLVRACVVLLLLGGGGAPDVLSCIFFAFLLICVGACSFARARE